MTSFRFTFSLAIILVLVFAVDAFADERSSELTGKTLITADVVTVGDLFTNAGGSAQHVLAPAPAIGDKLNLSANDLQRVAKAFRLNWKSDAVTGISLERDATSIDLLKITTALNDSELKAKVPSEAEFQLTNLQDAIILPGHEKAELTVSDTTYNAQDKSFSAVLNIKRGDKMVKQVTLEGTAYIMMHVPALKFAMAYNAIITENDITEIVVPETQMRGDAIFKREDLVGMTAKRTLAANQILTQQDVTAPVMIKRNDLVTITYKNGAIRLSSKARSLGNGTRGDNLQFLNTTSNKAFEAKVTGPQQAEVNLDS